jgi:hypothetical protein
MLASLLVVGLFSIWPTRETRQPEYSDELPSVDERLAASLDAANEALADIGARLAREDLTAFETHGRFIDSRYKDDEAIKG